MDLCLELLRENVQSILDGTATSKPQGQGTYHSKTDIIEASTVKESVTPEDLFDLCRATCNKTNGFRVNARGKRYLVRLHSVEEV